MPFDRRYFETQYRDYERQNPARKLEFYRRLAEAAAGGRDHPRILDVGCAFGHFLKHLGPRWGRCGVDASEYAVGRARDLVPEAEFEVSSGGGWGFAGPFDVVTALDVLEHVPVPEEALERFFSALRPGGGLVFAVPVYDGPTGPFIRILDRDPTHLHKQSRDYWLALASARFCVVDWWGIYRYLLPGGYYVHLVTRLGRRLTPAIACLARRRD
jgi:SAM-dependent methyltransferase